MRLGNTVDWVFSSPAGHRRMRRRLVPAVRPLEDRQLLSAAPTATMSQTATFPNLETLPNVANQAFLYFSSTMGTLTEVDVVTSGSYTSQFSAENLGSTASTITGTTTANLSINVPTGAISLAIPSANESFNASAFDHALDDAGMSGKTFAPVVESSAPQTTVFTSPAELAAFTGLFRMPVTVSGHATGNASSTNGDVSDSFTTQTSVTVTIIYHYSFSLPSLDPPGNSGSQPSGGQSTGMGTGNSGTPDSSTGQTNAVANAVHAVQNVSTKKHHSTTEVKKKGPKVVAHHPIEVKLPPKPGHTHKVKPQSIELILTFREGPQSTGTQWVGSLCAV